MQKKWGYLLFWIVLTTGMLSCKLPQQTIAGRYELNGFAKQAIILNPDNTFNIQVIAGGLSDGRYVYNISFTGNDSASQTYLQLRGKWKRSGRNSIRFLHPENTSRFSVADIKISAPQDSTLSRFHFMDKRGHTIQVTHTQTYRIWSAQQEVNVGQNGYIKRAPLLPVLNAAELLVTVFYFANYQPFVFSGGRVANRDYEITLLPKTRSGYFSGKRCRLEKNILLDKKDKRSFVKITPDISIEPH